MDILVLETVSKVTIPELARVNLVEELSTGPLKRPHHNSVVPVAHLQGPAALRLVASHLIQEVRMERRITLIEHRLLVFSQHVAEVLVAMQVASLLQRQSAEGLITSQLMERCHLESTFRANVAISLDRTHDRSEPVQLSQVALWHFDLFFLRLVRIFGLLYCVALFVFFLSDGVRLYRYFLFLCAFLLVQQFAGFSHEKAGAGIDKSILLGHGQAKGWHLFEFEVRGGGQSPVELLGGELVLASECNGARDEVVSVDASDLAPEEDLVSLHSGAQLAQTHFELHPI